ncbi:LuxR C-terminal-related transcriptional regulator [Actinoplanes sp. RD1]|uniref:LuxR C-terminal-related transcriptional regulator n=1 Tax=Actinoplanes sp. RD1 TaxID=3064538 RepID=UPI0027427EF2|nr:LuxR C-terminal-related transcriptional regulator [Actinoplanes sp. RD1]
MFEIAVVSEQPARLRVLASGAGMRVAATVPTIGDLADRGGRYDVVVLDLPDNPRPGDIARTTAAGPPLVSADWLEADLLPAVRAGARGLVERHTRMRDTIDALRVIAGGGFYVCPPLLGRFRTELAGDGDGPRTLAPREIETLRFIASGFTHAQIAARMGLSRATVDTYAKRIRAKLNARNQRELVRAAAALGHHPVRGPRPPRPVPADG